MKIINSLNDNARQSFRQIAKGIKVSMSTVSNRVKNLEEKGIIKGYTIQVDHEKLGYDLTVLINVNVSGATTFFEEKNALTELAEPNAIYNTTGDNDIMVIAKFKNREELSNFTKNLLRMKHVQGTKTQLVLKTLVEDFNKIR